MALIAKLIVFGIIVLLTALLAWITNRVLTHGAGVGRVPRPPQRFVAVLVAVVLFAGALSAFPFRWGLMGETSLLHAIKRTTIARRSPPGVRLLSQRDHVSTYADRHDPDYQDQGPDRTSHVRTYRAEADLSEVFKGFDQLASGSGWTLIGVTCHSLGSPGGQVGPQRKRHSIACSYQRRIVGSRATLVIWSMSLPSGVFHGTTISDIFVRVAASPAFSNEAPTARQEIDQECAPPTVSPRPPPPPGACGAANRRLAVVTSEPGVPLESPPVKVGPRRRDFTQMSEPRQLLKRHRAVGSHQTYDLVSTDYYGSPECPAKTFAYEFPSHSAARAFHQEAVERARRQAIESFDVPNIVDAIGLRLYVPAPRPDCNEHFYLQWGMTRLGSQCDDWVIDYVAFVRGQYQLTLLAGIPEADPPGPSGVRAAVLKQASGAA